MAEQVDQGAAVGAGAGKGRGLFFWVKIAVILLVIAGAGGAVWYFFLGGRAHFATETKVQPEAPLPVFVEIKPFVVTIAPGGGPSHFVQLGLNLKMSTPGTGDAVAAVMPELQDAMRQTVIGFKLEDLQNPAGVNKLREALVAQANAVLARALGAGRIKRLTGTDANRPLVENIYFDTLVIE